MCSPDGGSDILIKGLRNRNRALHGDTVIIEVLPETEWVVNHEAVQDFLETDASTEADHRVLLERAVFNIKQEKIEEEAEAVCTSTGTGNDQTRLEVTIELDQSPVRSSDTAPVPVVALEQASGSAVVSTMAAVHCTEDWGAGKVGSGQWDTSGLVEDAAANRILSACLLEEELRIEEAEGADLPTVLQTDRVAAQASLSAGTGTDLVVPPNGPAQPLTTITTTFAATACVNSDDRLSSNENEKDMEEAKKVEEEEEVPVVIGINGEVESASESDYESAESTQEEVFRSEEQIVRAVEDPDMEWEWDGRPSPSSPDELGGEVVNLGEMFKNLRCNRHPNLDHTPIDTTDDELADPDVVVETTKVYTKYIFVTDTSSKKKPETDGTVKKKTRRGSRGSKRKWRGNDGLRPAAAASASLPQQQPVIAAQVRPVPANQPPRRPPRVAMVEYAVAAVLGHPRGKDFVQRTGRVVNILEFKHSRIAAGTLKLMADRNPNFALFSPSDSRFPRMKIPMSECPPNYLQRSEDYASTMFMGKLLEWDMVNSARGQLIKTLGDSSEIAVRMEGLLLEHSIDTTEFGPEVLAALPANHTTWSIPQEEVAARRDYRGECVFTIDPLTARDLDDALSVTRLQDGNYRVGVHIADVSYFIPEGSTLDQVAAERATSTYLVHQVIPMLPRPLCENLCSLNPGEDRLCYTVEWTLSPEGEILTEWFGRTVIRSCVKLAYEHAQSLIDRPSSGDWSEGELPSIESPYTVAIISEKVNMLQLLAVKLRGIRERQGYLRLDQPKLSFTLDPATGMPTGFRMEERRQSNKLIEEFMLLANMAVAKRIHAAFPTLAMLRRHPPPKKVMLNQTVAQMKSLGLDLAAETAGSLGASIARLGLDAGTALVYAVVTCLFSKTMELAQYFCSGMFHQPDYHHFALNVPFYTHFTSPIRRYPDIIVHRLLEYAVKGQTPDWKMLDVQNQALHSNDKKLLAKRAGEASCELFLALFVAQSGPLSQAGSVVNVHDHSVDVLLVELGLVRRVYLDRLAVNTFKVRRHNAINYIDIVWKGGRRQTLTTFSQVELSLHKGDRPFEFITIIEPPGGDQQQQQQPDMNTITID